METAAPAGCNGLTRAVKIFVRNDGVTATQSDQPSVVSTKNNEYKQYFVQGQPDNTWQIRVWNNSGVSLPSTGGSGTNLICLFGVMLTSIAGIGLVMGERQRESA